jgi:2-amino-4-hydroxy-6-hydroxymethyldihydropteridine diphosphokinase
LFGVISPQPSIQPEPVRACIALGSNLGDRRSHINFALDALRHLPHTRVIAVSDIIETDPVGPPGQGPYLNAAATLETRLSARELLSAQLEIERRRGRDRSSGLRWGPRTLDLDLLLFGDGIISEPGLAVPHPRLHERLFVLIPLEQVAGDTLVPISGRTVSELLKELRQAQDAAPLPE